MGYKAAARIYRALQAGGAAQLRRFERAADRMAPLERAIFLGHVVDELSYAKLAEMHGIAIIEVEAHLWRALGKLPESPGDKKRFWLRLRRRGAREGSCQ
jgi:DNA-directed RNA polymerase specialized sigma24 family protein